MLVACGLIVKAILGMSERKTVLKLSLILLGLVGADVIFLNRHYIQTISEDVVESNLVTDYLRHGGMILFDTRDQSPIDRLNTGRPRRSHLRTIVEGLNLPPMLPVPAGHALTRAFYLIDAFPGRWTSGQVWVESYEGDVNDGVSSIVIGGNDYAAALLKKALRLRRKEVGDKTHALIPWLTELSKALVRAPKRALPLFSGCLDALAEAHSLGIVHKDLKPENLFVIRPGSHRPSAKPISSAWRTRPSTSSSSAGAWSAPAPHSTRRRAACPSR